MKNSQKYGKNSEKQGKNSEKSMFPGSKPHEWFAYYGAIVVQGAKQPHDEAVTVILLEEASLSFSIFCGHLGILACYVS